MHLYRPLLCERANCGPTVLATLLSVSTETAISLMNIAYEKGWNGYTNVGHIRVVLEKRGFEMKKIKDYDGMGPMLPCGMGFKAPTLLFIQLSGPWMGKGWRSEYNHTHWALFQDGMVMDVNNIFEETKDKSRPEWVRQTVWEMIVMPHLMKVMGADGWKARSGYKIIVQSGGGKE